MTIREQLFAMALLSIAVWLILSFDWQDWLLEQRGRNLIMECENPKFRHGESFWKDGDWLYREYVYECADGRLIVSRKQLTAEAAADQWR